MTGRLGEPGRGPVTADVVVAGAGPAGLAVAAELAVRGAAVVIVDPHPDRAWPATYCGWADELAAAPGFDSATSVRVRHRPVIIDASGRVRALDRDYLQLDQAGAAAGLRRRAAAGPGTLLQLAGRVTAAVQEADRVRVQLAARAGEPPCELSVSARVVVDATGAGGGVGIERKPASDATVWQWAVGIISPFTPTPTGPGGAVLMDWRQVRAAQDDPRVPGSFSYVLDRGDGTHLVEETVLAGPRVKGVMRVLRGRLAARLAAAGWHAEAPVAEELVAIPLDIGPRRARGPVLPVGVAGGLVHPASGYSVTAALRTAPAVAEAVAGALAAGATPDEIAAAGSAALWPRGAVAAHAALARGMRTTLRQDATETAAFFASFFALPTPIWSGYLAQPADPVGVAQAMGRLWLSLKPWDSARLVGRWVAARRV